MFNQILKVAGVGFATTLALALSANNAQALDFDFSGFQAGKYSAEGTLRVKDSAITTGSNLLTKQDFEDWKITLTNTDNSTSYDLFGPGGTFNATNSAFDSVFAPTTVIASATTSSLDFTRFFYFRENNISGTSDQIFIGNNPDGFGNFASCCQFTFDQDNTPNIAFPTASATATPVPFEVSPNLSIIILGGLYGASRLRKKLAASR